MAELATDRGVFYATGSNVSGSTIGRGLRVLYGATGLITLAPIGVRGDYVTMQDIANNDVGLIAPLSSGKVPAVASLAVAMGDPAYSAANGQFSNVLTSAVICGKFTQPASGAGILTEVELESVI